ncbi:hypothetical protein LOY64_12655 [Pseudomonas corrugata]|uniref:hypothetical protein n=1 Tax=Pseudomonas TaxID=286 RepID=UPI00069D15C7|nr:MULTISPECIES: hypothetical protein [Pseudomonas]OAB49332.1 hypothetical protein APS14_12315 [Pseudomonas thivervalensis]MDD2030867.1 hypothetical protein [Pseudomonas sp. 39167]QHA82222.1 hypothetical protein E3Z27_11275 [Pseudomonas mediterranea]UZD97801.1 hypothetical protein LOY64_12655 [Pseudomonas corrugata]SDF76866.1 hypothetical protein SAMN04490204_1775 [Pseudomonas thivervalensis]
MFSKTGNSFLAQRQYAAGIARALHMELGGTHQATKTLMRWTNANEKTVKNWMAGSNGPSGMHLVALVKHSDLALAAFLRMAGRPHALTASELPALRQKLQTVIEGIDSYLRVVDAVLE